MMKKPKPHNNVWSVERPGQTDGWTQLQFGQRANEGISQEGRVGASTGTSRSWVYLEEEREEGRGSAWLKGLELESGKNWSEGLWH